MEEPEKAPAPAGRPKVVVVEETEQQRNARAARLEFYRRQRR
jgi:hypothetical protein